ncbi:tryptophan 7-halogenase [Erythrobacter sp. F6033]|uniref:tryptophan 7-halogenase n=1 Tax=Erythrobacter sp. F6033 TaxID=2926401 RepID=UPI001FF42D6D|nr:tryptophan 7-halogenase [Erythrobacter sp. F6033]MCK0127640.1 tryptophan 7-halogenase [Erythrobacter sp. F6033]
MTTKRILVSGDRLGVSVVGATLAKRWLGPGRELIIAASGSSASGDELLARPEMLGFHGELGLAPDAFMRAVDARPAFAWSAQTPGGTVSIPFSPFGVGRGGVEFHHYWQRGAGIQALPDLSDFSLSLALHDAGKAVPMQQLTQLPVQFGMALNREKYAGLLLQFAQQSGARIVGEDAAGLGADISIRAGRDCKETMWSEGEIVIASSTDLAGIELQTLANAASRIAGLVGDLTDQPNERSEFNRLSKNEAARIADMRTLLAAKDLRKSASPQLTRKLDLFAACGRIPTEDFEVFKQPEWLTALRARGITPQRYDRMADRLPSDELMKWLTELRKQIVQIVGKEMAA